jgi:scyllo-inositol 2-dehydrogenase (NADP+)
MAIRTALVGFGFSGQTFHAPFLSALDEYQVTTVLSTKPELVQKTFPNALITTDFEQMLSQDVELVVITTPNTLHYDQTKRSILAKKHVIVEKPFMITSQEAEELVNLAKENSVLLSVYHNRRFADDFLTLKKLIQDGKMGELVSFEAHFDRFRPNVRDRWRENDLPGSGMLYDLGSHLIDQALHLFGRPDRIYADIMKQRVNSVVDDYFHIVLYFGTRRAILHSSLLVPSAPPMISAHGTGGSYYAEGFDPQEQQLISGILPTTPDFGIRPSGGRYAQPEKPLQEIAFEKGDMTSYYRSFANAVRNGGKIPVVADEVITVMQVIEAAKKSAELGSVVTFH